MVVVSYEWYKTTYGGGLDEDTFNRLASQAFLFADAMTEYGRSSAKELFRPSAQLPRRADAR